MKRLVVLAVVVAVGLAAVPGFVAPGYSAARQVADALAVATPAAAIVFLLLSARSGKGPRPAGFLVRAGTPSFAVPATRGYGFMALGWLALLAVQGERVVDVWVHPAGDSFAPVFEVLGTMSTVLWAVLAVAVVGTVLGDRPLTELTAGGVVVRGVLGRRSFVPWEALRPGTPVRGYGPVELVVDRPALVQRRRFARQVGMSYADVHPWFFADAVRFYVDHPARRAEIGTPVELEHLLSDLGVLAQAS